MQRKKFLSALVAAAVAPTALLGRSISKTLRTGKAFVAKAGEGRYHGHIQLKGVNANILDVKVSGKDTGGDLAIFEQTSLSHRRGTPLHIHPNQDEVFQVLEGEYRFVVGGETHDVKEGDSIFLPRNVPHAWSQLSKRGRMSVLVQPAGKLEEFFVAMAAYKGEPSKEEIAKLFMEHEMQIVGPPIKLD